MSAPISSVEDVVNLALGRLGLAQRIGSIQEGSAPAKAALDIYGTTRDDVLRQGDWGFAQRQLTMTLLKTAPADYSTPWTSANPPQPWKYEYQYPGDCLKVRSIRGPQVFVPDFDPQPVVFQTPNDTVSSVVQKVIVSNTGPVAYLSYTGQITDPTQWEASFVDDLADALAERLAPILNPQAMQAAAQEEQAADAEAKAVQG